MKRTLFSILVAVMMMVTAVGMTSVTAEASGKYRSSKGYTVDTSKKSSKKKTTSSKSKSKSSSKSKPSSSKSSKSKSSSSKSKKGYDSYNVHDYKSAQDFADDKYEEFYDYEDDYDDEDEAYDAAEDYWNDNY